MAKALLVIDVQSGGPLTDKVLVVAEVAEEAPQ